MIFHRNCFRESITFVFIMEKKIKDKELGTITISHNTRATRYILKVKDGELFATLPAGGNEASLMRFIEENKEKLLQQLSRRSKKIFDESTRLKTFSFTLHIFCTDRTDYYLSLKEEILHIACPERTDFAQPAVQDILNELIQKALRHEARRLLPSRLKTLASQHGFTFSDIKIQSSKGRWGSCSSRKAINLSYHLMLLPGHLIDYVLLHELCHTLEMNHGERFWKLMDNVTAGKALNLRKELKKYHPMG